MSLLLPKQQSNHIYRRVIQASLSSYSNTKPNTWFSKKGKSNRTLQFNFEMASDPAIEEILTPFRAAVKEQVVI